MIIYGDFNFPHARFESIDVDGGQATIGFIPQDSTGSTNSDALFLEQLEIMSLQQLVTFPTYIDSLNSEARNTLDLIITDDPSRVCAIESSAPLGQTPKGRAHLVLNWCIPVASQDISSTSRSRFIWSKADWTKISESISQHNWKERFDSLPSVDECYAEFLAQYSKACQDYIPRTSKPVKPAQLAQWLDKPARIAITNKRICYGRWRAAGKANKQKLLNEYKEASKQVRKVVKKAVENYEIKLATNTKKDKKFLHSYFNNQRTISERVCALKDKNGTIHTDSKEICDILNDNFHDVFTIENDTDEQPLFSEQTDKHIDPKPDELFNKYIVWKRLEDVDPNKSVGPDGVHPRVLKECAEAMSIPLSEIFQRSHIEGCAPRVFKQANVVPIFKKGCKTNPTNYRPISLTSVPCKIQESIQHDVILAHLIRENLLSRQQHGFLPRKSCVTNLLESYEFMSNSLANGEHVDVIYMDFSKAFDTVPHNRLLNKLQAYGIRGQLLLWIRDWLTTRKQRVVLANNNAEWRDVLSGVPQGSVLGPLLFVIFINDLATNLHNEIRMYADDTKILGRATTSEDRERLQQDIDKCVEWARTWMMKFNIAKCKVMHVGRGHIKSKHEYFMRDELDNVHTLTSTKIERDLGVLVSSDLKFESQCKAAAAKANWAFGDLKRVFSTRNPKLWEILWKAHIRPHLEHAPQAWSPYNEADIKVLEQVQRRLTKHIDGMKGLSYEERLTRLGWTTLEKRRLRGDLIFTYQVLHNNATVNLNWHWAKPLETVEGPAASVRANPVRVMPPIFQHCKQRNHFITSRIETPLRELPNDMMKSDNVNIFKNAFDKIYT